MAQQKPSFDMSRISMGSKLLLGAGILLFIDLFLPWNRTCEERVCVSASGWHGLGALAGILLLVLLAWEIINALGVDLKINMGTFPRFWISVGLGGAVALFAILRALIRPGVLFFHLDYYIFGWIGLIIGLAVGAGAFLKFREAQGAPIAPPSGGAPMGGPPPPPASYPPPAPPPAAPPAAPPSEPPPTSTG